VNASDRAILEAVLRNDLTAFTQRPQVQITLQLRKSGFSPPLALSYWLDRTRETECRLLVKLVLQLRPGLRDGVFRRLGPGLDWIMMRRQLLNLKALAEGAG